MIDAYIVGSEYTKDDMIKRGIPADIIYPFGIPVREAFHRKSTDSVPRGHRRDHPRDHHRVMAGSMGSSGMEKAFAAVMKAEQKIRIIVVCGHNDALVHDLNFWRRRLYQDPSRWWRSTASWTTSPSSWTSRM